MERPSEDEARKAVETLIRWAGDDPAREGLRGTPDRVVRSYSEFFGGYTQDPVDILSRTFEQVEGYDELIVLRDIPLESHCEHHMVPFVGTAHIGYLPIGGWSGSASSPGCSTSTLTGSRSRRSSPARSPKPSRTCSSRAGSAWSSRPPTSA